MGRDDLLAARVPLELVGGREEKSLESASVRIQIRDKRSVSRRGQEVGSLADLLAIELVGDIVHCPTLGNSDCLHKDLAVSDLPKGFARIQRVVEQVFARLKRLAKMPLTVKAKSQAISDDVILAKDSCNIPARSTSWNINEHFFRAAAAIRAADLRVEPSRAGSHCGNGEQRQ